MAGLLASLLLQWSTFAEAWKWLLTTPVRLLAASFGVDLPRGTLKKGLENGTHHSVAMGMVVVPTKPEGPAIVTNPNETL